MREAYLDNNAVIALFQRANQSPRVAAEYRSLLADVRVYCSFTVVQELVTNKRDDWHTQIQFYLSLPNVILMEDFPSVVMRELAKQNRLSRDEVAAGPAVQAAIRRVWAAGAAFDVAADAISFGKRAFKEDAEARIGRIRHELGITSPEHAKRSLPANWRVSREYVNHWVATTDLMNPEQRAKYDERNQRRWQLPITQSWFACEIANAFWSIREERTMRGNDLFDMFAYAESAACGMFVSDDSHIRKLSDRIDFNYVRVIKLDELLHELRASARPKRRRIGCK